MMECERCFDTIDFDLPGIMVYMPGPVIMCKSCFKEFLNS